MLLNFISWHVNPEIFHIGHFAIRWYGLLFALSFYFGYLIINQMFKKEGVPQKVLDQLTTYMLIGTVIGARLGHVLFYEPAWYFSHPLDILKIWEGGLASHGAAIGILLALWIFSKKSKRPFLWTIDRIVIVVALSGLLIRTGNLMNSEIFGKPTSLPWGFIFEHYDEVPRHPTQIYEGFSYLAIFLFLLNYYYRKNGAPTQGVCFGIFLIATFTMRFLIEFLKEPQVGFESKMVLNMGQLFSIPLILLGIGILIWIKQKRKTV